MKQQWFYLFQGIRTTEQLCCSPFILTYQIFLLHTNFKATFSAFQFESYSQLFALNFWVCKCLSTILFYHAQIPSFHPTQLLHSLSLIHLEQSFICNHFFLPIFCLVILPSIDSNSCLSFIITLLRTLLH